MNPNCPRCKDKKLEVALDSMKDNPLSYVCKDGCKEEFYICSGNLLLTREEFFRRRKEEQ